MKPKWIIALAGLLIVLATILSAFGAHALQGRLTPERLNVYEIAVRHHFYHALGLLAIGLAARIGVASMSWPAILIATGIVLFSGSIYALSFGAPRAIGMLTPMGGLALIAGWILFAVAAIGGRD